MGKTKTIEIFGSSNVGLFAYANDNYCLIGKNLPEEVKKVFELSLDVPVYEITIGGSQQIGAFVKGNNNKLLVPDSILPKEEEVLKQLKIDFCVIKTKSTALGNNLIIGDKHFFYIHDMESEAVKTIENYLGIKGSSLYLEDWDVIGSVVVLNSKGGLIQKDVPEEIKKEIEKKLDLELEPGTINFGSRVLGGGIVVNSFGMVVGKASVGIEVTNADLAFGFLEK